MGNPEKEREAYGGSGWAAEPPRDGMPPAYEYAPPPGPPPGFSEKAAPAAYDAGLSSSNAPFPVPSTQTVRFPQKMTLTSKISHGRTLFLGPTKKDVLYLVSIAHNPYLLKDGPKKESPNLASFMNDSSTKGYKQSIITLFPRPSGELKQNLSITLLGSYESEHRFDLEVSDGNIHKREWFAWRDSNGPEVQELAGTKLGSGYILVRLGIRYYDKAGTEGYASDGTKIMAVTTGKLNPFTRDGDYIEFKESFGETFETAVVTTWLRLYIIAAFAGQGLAA